MKNFLTMLLVASVVGILMWFVFVPMQSPKPSPSTPTSVTLPSVPSVPTRPRYSHSLIPGGVSSIIELRETLNGDPALASWFRTFDFDHAHETTLPVGIWAYVSFRVGDKIRWTQKRIWLPAGEKVITDGTTDILMRCGNSLAAILQEPNAPEDLFVLTLALPEVITPAPVVAESFVPLTYGNDTPIPPAVTGTLSTPGTSGTPGIPIYFGVIPPPIGVGVIAVSEPRQIVFEIWGLLLLLGMILFSMKRKN